MALEHKASWLEHPKVALAEDHPTECLGEAHVHSCVLQTTGSNGAEAQTEGEVGQQPCSDFQQKVEQKKMAWLAHVIHKPIGSAA